MSMSRLYPDLNGWIDLLSVPFTTLNSRLFMYRNEGGFTVYEAGYERPLEASIALKNLRLFARDRSIDIAAICPDMLIFDDGTRLSLSAGGEVLLAHIGDETRIEADGNPVEVGAWRSVIFSPSALAHRPAGHAARLRPHAVAEADVEAAIGEVSSRTAQWMARCPRPRAPWEEMVRRCWWVLGCNMLLLDTPGAPREAVIPSKLGYVGAWQWDSYFIALGLRWGDPQLAAQQLRLAVAWQGDDGALPDVAFDGGILASSADLPEADLARLHELASPSLRGSTVPLTKPPLLAWAVDGVAQMLPAEQARNLRQDMRPHVAANVDWWDRVSSRHGRAYYLHPYSSGLDDCPIFDYDALVSSPDLLAYLADSYARLAVWHDQAGDTQAARYARERLAQLRALCLTQWDHRRGFFPAVGENGNRLEPLTIVSLMPLLLGEQLAPDMRSTLVSDLQHGGRFATPFRVPTVAPRDASYHPSRMWRGPVWINTGWLVCQGLRRCGHTGLAREIETELMTLVDRQGPCEYYEPESGQCCTGAVTLFSWSAALAIDLALRD